MENTNLKIGKTLMKTLSIIELSEIVSAIRNFNLDIDKYCKNKVIKEMIDTDTDVALFLTIEVYPSIYKDTSNLDYINGTGYSCELIEEGYFELKKVQPYYEYYGDCQFDELSMKVINSELDNHKIFLK